MQGISKRRINYFNLFLLELAFLSKNLLLVYLNHKVLNLVIHLNICFTGNYKNPKVVGIFKLNSKGFEFLEFETISQPDLDNCDSGSTSGCVWKYLPNISNEYF